jgi:hypothetical protein
MRRLTPLPVRWTVAGAWQMAINSRPGGFLWPNRNKEALIWFCISRSQGSLMERMPRFRQPPGTEFYKLHQRLSPVLWTMCIVGASSG